jgi:2-C-methyl-D-erythritol 2,4-cyclodiphosphate synthase
MRIGSGYDIHPLESGRALILGGVSVPYECGLGGHSDGDVLAHAIIDALLGAAALGDIGRHFPAKDVQWRGADSVDLLRRTTRLVVAARYRIVNIDATVIAEAPLLTPHIGAMRVALSKALGVEQSVVSVKATTSDGLGSLGRGEGIAALAVALLDSA